MNKLITYIKGLVSSSKKNTHRDPCRTVPNADANPTYCVHTSMGSWRGRANSIVHALTLTRKSGIRGHVYAIMVR